MKDEIEPLEVFTVPPSSSILHPRGAPCATAPNSSLARGPRFQLGETPRQAGMLFSAHTISMGLGFLSTLILGRGMEPAEMGRFALCQTIVLIAGLFFEVGVFPAGARVLALAKEPEAEARAVGALVLMAAAIGAALSLFIAAAAIPIDLIFSKDIRWVLIATSALAFFQPFQSLVESSCQGLNRIKLLSAFQLLSSLVNLLILIALAVAGRLTASTALGAYLAAIGVAAVWTVSRMRPRFKDRGRYIRLTLKETRSYGLNIYLARITGTVSTRLDNLVIGYFLGLNLLGLYAVAQKLSSPVLTIARSLAITRFRAFTKLSSIPARIVRWNTAVLILGAAGVAIVGPFALPYIFPSYAEAAPLFVPLAFWNLFSGLFQPYNMFLASHGRGAEIRNIAVTITFAEFIGLIICVPRFGIQGAAWAAAAAMALDYALALYYYQKFKQTLEQDTAIK
jgi:stage V sporulation protein B